MFAVWQHIINQKYQEKKIVRVSQLMYLFNDNSCRFKLHFCQKYYSNITVKKSLESQKNINTYIICYI